MKIENAVEQMQAVARLAGLPALFGELSFEAEDIEALGSFRNGERTDVRFSNESGPIGVLHAEVLDDPEGPGLAVGLRGWALNDDVACVQ